MQLPGQLACEDEISCSGIAWWFNEAWTWHRLQRLEIFFRRKLPHAEQRGQVPMMLLRGLRLYNLFINTFSGSLVEFWNLEGPRSCEPLMGLQTSLWANNLMEPYRSTRLVAKIPSLIHFPEHIPCHSHTEPLILKLLHTFSEDSSCFPTMRAVTTSRTLTLATIQVTWNLCQMPIWNSDWQWSSWLHVREHREHFITGLEECSGNLDSFGCLGLGLALLMPCC